MIGSRASIGTSATWPILTNLPQKMVFGTPTSIARNLGNTLNADTTAISDKNCNNDKAQAIICLGFFYCGIYSDLPCIALAAIIFIKGEKRS